MNTKIGDAVIIPGGKTWTGRRGKLIGISEDESICKVDADGYAIDVFAFDISLSYGKERGKGQRIA